MKIALLALLGLVLGVLGGAALGIGAGLAWIEIFKTTSLEGDSGMLVFFTFMPLGAVVGGLGGALAFGVMAVRDAENRHRKGTCTPPRQLGFDPASLNRARRLVLFKHDFRANASRLSRAKTGTPFSGSCSESIRICAITKMWIAF